MNKIIRYYYWIVLSWVILVLLFFKLYNNFYFKNNESIIFIIALLIVPISLSIVKIIIHKKNLKHYYDCKNNYYLLLENLINNDLTLKLTEITNIKTIDRKIYFGKNFQGVLTFNDVYLEIRILNTYVSYKFYYNKTINDLLLFDRTGYQNQDPIVLYNDVLMLIKSLLSGKLTYQEVRKHNKVIISKLYIDDILKFSYQEKPQKKLKKITKNLTIEL